MQEEKDKNIINIVSKYIVLVDDPNFGYGITIKGLYTFKTISKEEYDTLKKGGVYCEEIHN